MNRMILTGALGAAALALSACGGTADDTTAEDTAAADAAATAATIEPATTTDWPAGTRIVQEGDVTYRIDPGGTRVVLADDDWRIVTEGGARYRVSPAGTRIRIDDNGIDVTPDIPGVDVDVGTNTKGNLDVDVSTDGTDASDDRPGD